jgi:CO/xanthine dehydrogenase FAD-binding subunit
MTEFQYMRASRISDAVVLLNEPGVICRPLAGGTDLMLLLRSDSNFCERVVDISLIPELHTIQRRGDQVTIGAGVTFSEVIGSPIVTETAPLLVQACAHVGAVQIRNMGTLGGNVCNAAACADSLPALVCLEAQSHITTPQGEQVLPVGELVVNPNQTLLPQGGLLVALSYQVPHSSSNSVFLKLGRRNAMAISRLTLAVLGHLDKTGRIAEARIVPGAATPQISRLKTAEDSLLGQLPGVELFAATARLAVEEMIRMAGRRWSSEFKEPALMAMTERALKKVFATDRPGAGSSS